MCGGHLGCEASGGEKGPEFGPSTPEFKKKIIFPGRRHRPPPLTCRGESPEKQKPDLSQDEFRLAEPDAPRGHFDKTDRILYSNNEDLNAPTLLRRGIKIRIKA